MLFSTILISLISSSPIPDGPKKVASAIIGAMAAPAFISKTEALGIEKPSLPLLFNLDGIPGREFQVLKEGVLKDEDFLKNWKGIVLQDLTLAQLEDMSLEQLKAEIFLTPFHSGLAAISKQKSAIAMLNDPKGRYIVGLVSVLERTDELEKLEIIHYKNDLERKDFRQSIISSYLQFGFINNPTQQPLFEDHLTDILANHFSATIGPIAKTLQGKMNQASKSLLRDLIRFLGVILKSKNANSQVLASSFIQDIAKITNIQVEELKTALLK